MNKVIEKMNALVNRYHTMNNLNGADLNELLKQLTSSLYYLETVRSDYHDKWQISVNQMVNEGKSVARAENMAHVEYPQMYQLRRVMTSGYKVCEAIRSNISYLKQEMNNLS